IDQAILAYRKPQTDGYSKLDEEPYDFVRKRLSVMVGHANASLIITKGALANVLEVCTTVETATGQTLAIAGQQQKIEEQFKEFSSQGYRVVGLAYRELNGRKEMDKSDETEMTFLGFLTLFDPIKPGTLEAIQNLRKL